MYDSKCNKNPPGPTVDVSCYNIFECLHMDFQFYTPMSIRGFTSALTVVCAKASYPFAFPTKTKSPPIEIFTWFISTIRAMGYIAIYIRVDEDGSLARSTEFCNAVVDSNCVLQTTGGGNSEGNGKVERPHRTMANMV